MKDSCCYSRQYTSLTLTEEGLKYPRFFIKLFKQLKMLLFCLFNRRETLLQRQNKATVEKKPITEY